MERDERGVEGREGDGDGDGLMNAWIFFRRRGRMVRGIYRRNCLIRFSLSTLFKVNDRIDLK